jgi:hypothetical protein
MTNDQWIRVKMNASDADRARHLKGRDAVFIGN